jgi:hypothetical protein
LNSSRQTASGLITGTPAYMSPEQAMGQATDGRTDIYSLGIVLYEMLSGDVPFDAETTMSILLKHINEAPPPIRGLSPALQRVLDRALAKSPDERFQQPEEFAAAFTTALDERSDASTLVVPPLPVPPRNGKARPRAQHNWMRIVLAGALALLLAIPLLSRGIFNAAQQEPTPGSSVSDVPGDTPVFEIPVTLGPTGMLLFQDGNATLDQTSLIAYAMPAPPTGNHYRVWLANDEDRLTLGTLDVDGSGRGELVFNDPGDGNLLAMYHRVEVTIEGNNQASAEGEEAIAYAYALPDQGLVYLRGLMAAFPALPENTGLIQGLTANVESINEAARQMLAEFQNGNEAAVREEAESIASLLVGEQSPDYQDWDGDGQISDPGNGYGLLLNGNNLGYIQAVYSHADYAINSPGATRNMIVNGEDVKLCTQNLARWAPELRNHILTILDAGTLSEMEAAIRRSAELADQMLNGIDLDESGQVTPASDECGVLLAYEQTYHMADMPLLPVAFNSLDTPVAITGTPTSTVTVGTPLIIRPTREPADSGGTGPAATQAPPNEAPATSAPPADPPGNSNPKPTKEPKPTDKPKDNPGQSGSSDPPDDSVSTSNSRPTKKP